MHTHTPLKGFGGKNEKRLLIHLNYFPPKKIYFLASWDEIKKYTILFK